MVSVLKNQIHFKFHDDGAGDTALIVKFHAKDFSGRAVVYLDAENISNLLDAFAVYPIPPSDTPKIEWGVIDPNDRGRGLIEEHFHFSVWPMDTQGHLVASVRAAVPYVNIAGRLQYQGGVDIRTTYADIAKFVEEMKCMLRGEVSEVVLEEVVG